MRRTTILALALGLALVGTSAHAVTVSLLADPLEVASGGIVSVEIVATDFGEGEFASGYDFAISFDPLQFAFGGSFAAGVALGSVLDNTNLSGVDDGSLLPFVTSLLEDPELAALQPGPSVVLGSFELVARRTSVPLEALIGLQCNSVSGPFVEGLAVLLEITACDGASVSVAPVAAGEPGTLALLALGLLGIAVSTRRLNSGR
jgi:hypothetical protein